MPLPRDPFGLFSLFLYDSLIGLIVDETNRYAEQSLRVTEKEWSTNVEEIRTYLGFIILMGINKLPEIRDYWSTNDYTILQSRIGSLGISLSRSHDFFT